LIDASNDIVDSYRNPCLRPRWSVLRIVAGTAEVYDVFVASFRSRELRNYWRCTSIHVTWLLMNTGTHIRPTYDDRRW